MYEECQNRLGIVVKANSFPLTFWRMRGEQFPYLNLLARKYLSIPASAVPSEQIFATAQ